MDVFDEYSGIERVFNQNLYEENFCEDYSKLSSNYLRNSQLYLQSFTCHFQFCLKLILLVCLILLSIESFFK